MAEQAEALERRTEELESWAAELAVREEQPAPEPPPPEVAPPEPAPPPRSAAAGEPPAQPVPTADGRWNLFSLQRLVDERGGEHPSSRGVVVLPLFPARVRKPSARSRRASTG